MIVDKIVDVLEEQKEWIKSRNDLIEREIDLSQYTNNKEIIAILGIRRSGKSYLLIQIAKKTENFGFVNFEDQRFINFKHDNYDALLKAIFMVYGSTKTFLFDEIQVMPHWETFVRRLYNLGYKIYLTGSNASLLSGELSTSLTGRHLNLFLMPFSFSEIIGIKSNNINIHLTEHKAKIMNLFDEYLKEGGFPQYILFNNSLIVTEIIQDIMYKDVIPRYKIESINVLNNILIYLARNVGKEISYNNITRVLKLNSVNTTKKYVNALKEVYMVFLLPKYTESPKKFIVANKKVYFVDTGLRNKLVVYRQLDKGNILENIVFIKLFRRDHRLFYFKQKNECDFVYKNKNGKFEVAQVTYELNDQNRNREIKGLLEAMEYFKLKKGLLLTYDQEDEIEVKDNKGKKRKIIMKPVWKWLLEKV